MIPVSEPRLGNREIEYVTDALRRGWVSPKGNYVSEFEDAFASIVGTEYAFATSTGTAALHLSLVAGGVGAGDEVVVPDLTWIACANVVRYVGATPVFADVDPETYTLDPESVRACLSEDTAAIMPVHIFGQPCEMGAILDIADERDLLVLEDAAEAHGASYGGEQVGSVGDIGCFSFYGNKIITTGQGGMITTDDDQIADQIRLFRRDGMSTERKYYHTVVGYNYRLTNIQAAIGVGQIERLSDILDDKRRVARTYRHCLDHNAVRFQSDPEWGESVHWMIAPIFESVRQRDTVQEALRLADIETRPFFHPLHKQPPYKQVSASCPVTSDLVRRGLILPSGPGLDEDTIARICDEVVVAL